MAVEGRDRGLEAEMEGANARLALRVRGRYCEGHPRHEGEWWRRGYGSGDSVAGRLSAKTEGGPEGVWGSRVVVKATRCSGRRCVRG